MKKKKKKKAESCEYGFLNECQFSFKNAGFHYGKKLLHSKFFLWIKNYEKLFVIVYGLRLSTFKNDRYQKKHIFFKKNQAFIMKTYEKIMIYALYT